MSIRIKFNGGDPVLVYSGTGIVTLESLGLTTRDEVRRLRSLTYSYIRLLHDAEAALEKAAP